MVLLVQDGATVVGPAAPLGYIGGTPIYLFGVTTALGVLIGVAVALLQAERFGLSLSRTFQSATAAVVAGVVGSRLGYVAVHWLDYRSALASVPWLPEGGFLFYGGLAGGLLAVLVHGRFVPLSVWRVLDAFAPGLAAGQAVGLIGAQVLGRATSAPWGVVVQETAVHPLPAYGIVLAYGLFFVLWRLGGGKVRPGALFLTYLLLHGVGSLVLGAWSTARAFSGMTPTQWGGLAATLLALATMYRRRRVPMEEAPPAAASGASGSRTPVGVPAATDVGAPSASPSASPSAGRGRPRGRGAWGARLILAALWSMGLLLLLAGFVARLN